MSTTTEQQMAQMSSDADSQWVLTSAFLIMFMQAGFAMLEAGTVASTNVQNIIYKNFLDMCIGAMMFYLVGYGFAYGTVSLSGFVGIANFTIIDNYAFFFLQYTFSSCATTIVSGAVTGRCKIEAYFIYSFVISGIVYPVVAHWVWSEDGWLFKRDMIDFAGSGVVHCTGGVVSLVGAFWIGPRLSRFKANSDGSWGEPRPVHPSNVLMQALGVFILWFGWYGFNCGSTLQVSDGGIDLAARVATTTTLSAAASTLTSVVVGKVKTGHFDLPLTLNCALAGLVSITAGCAEVRPYAAIIIGFIGSGVYIATSDLLLHFRIDDPLGAFPIHGACGCWGVLAAGMFAPGSSLHQFRVQLMGLCCIIGWSGVWAVLVFKFCEHTVGLRVPPEVEIEGIDNHEHGGAAVTTVVTWSLDDIMERRALRRALFDFMKTYGEQDNLDFLLNCREIFALLDLDERMEFLLEDMEALPAEAIVCKRSTWDLIIDLREHFLEAGSDKEVNLGVSLSRRIAACFKGTFVNPKKTISPSSTVACVDEADMEETQVKKEEKKPEKTEAKVSKDLTVVLIEAYIEIHKLVFSKFYGNFCQSPAFTKAVKRYK